MYGPATSPISFWPRDKRPRCVANNLTYTPISPGGILPHRIVTTLPRFRTTPKSMPCSEYTIDVFYRQRWTEPRLSHNVSGHLSINYNMLPYLWVPDTYMLNEKSSVFHEMTVPNLALFVFPDGYMLYSQR